MQTVTIVGAGLAGSEAAYQLAKRGITINREVEEGKISLQQ